MSPWQPVAEEPTSCCGCTLKVERGGGGREPPSSEPGRRGWAGDGLVAAPHKPPVLSRSDGITGVSAEVPVSTMSLSYVAHVDMCKVIRYHVFVPPIPAENQKSAFGPKYSH